MRLKGTPKSNTSAKLCSVSHSAAQLLSFITPRRQHTDTHTRH